MKEKDYFYLYALDNDGNKTIDTINCHAKNCYSYYVFYKLGYEKPIKLNYQEMKNLLNRLDSVSCCTYDSFEEKLYSVYVEDSFIYVRKNIDNFLIVSFNYKGNVINHSVLTDMNDCFKRKILNSKLLEIPAYELNMGVLEEKLERTRNIGRKLLGLTYGLERIYNSYFYSGKLILEISVTGEIVNNNKDLKKLFQSDAVYLMRGPLGGALLCVEISMDVAKDLYLCKLCLRDFLLNN